MKKFFEDSIAYFLSVVAKSNFVKDLCRLNCYGQSAGDSSQRFLLMIKSDYEIAELLTCNI